MESIHLSSMKLSFAKFDKENLKCHTCLHLIILDLLNIILGCPHEMEGLVRLQYQDQGLKLSVHTHRSWKLKIRAEYLKSDIVTISFVYVISVKVPWFPVS